MRDVSAVTTSSTAVTGTKSFDAFGNQVASTGTWAGPFDYAGPYGYQSDPDYGLQLVGHRYYDPSTGRFLTRDPIQDGRNWHAYCGGNPVSRVDPFGLFEMWGFEFTPQVVLDGIATGVNGLLSGASAGIYDGGDYKDRPGFAVSQVCGAIAAEALVTAATAGVGSAVARGGRAGKRLISTAPRARESEAVFTWTQNTKRISDPSFSAKYRIPDVLEDVAMAEVKDVNYQSLTKQLRDYIRYSIENGKQFTLYVDHRTTCSNPLIRIMKEAGFDITPVRMP